MRNLKFKRLLILSAMEKAAKMIKFSPKTLLVGANSTGKSVVLKSLYGSFDTNSIFFPDRWLRTEPITLLEFQCNGEDYYLLNRIDSIGIFDSEGYLLEGFYKSKMHPTNEHHYEYLNFLSLIFNTDFIARTRERKEIKPTIPIYFLPYYIDQDHGWNKVFNSFRNYEKILDLRRNTIDFHTNIRTDKYYLNASRSSRLEVELSNLNNEYHIINQYLKFYAEKLELHSYIPLSFGNFRSELSILLEKSAQILKLKEDKYNKLSMLQNDQKELKNQLTLVNKTILELDKDVNHDEDALLDAGVNCPTCGAYYKSSISKRFSLSKDIFKCKELRASIKIEMSKIEEEIKHLKGEYSELKEIYAVLKNKLSFVQDGHSLIDVIESFSKEKIQSLFSQSIIDLKSKFTTVQNQLRSAKREMFLGEDKDRKLSLDKLFIESFLQYCSLLDVPNPKELIKSIYSDIKPTSGSVLPRSILAYQFALHSVINKAEVTDFPFVIDSPNRDQDKLNLPKIFSFINQIISKNTQLIISSEEAPKKFDGDVINLTQKHKLLNENEYEISKEFLEPFINQLVDRLYSNLRPYY